MISLEQHKENAKEIKMVKEKERLKAAVEILKAAIGTELLEQAEDFGQSRLQGAYVKFKNHKKIFVERLFYVNHKKYDFYVIKDNGFGEFCGSLGDALIEAEIPNTFWNRLTRKYRR